MIEVKLYQNYSDPYKVHKNISLIATVQCEVTEEQEADSLELLLDMKSNIKQFNYCYIEKYGRYYFCTPKVVNGNQMRLICESDPLSSFWSSMASSPCIAERSTSHPNANLTDEMLPFKPQPIYIRRTLSTGFTPTSSGGCYILTVGGK